MSLTGNDPSSSLDARLDALLGLAAGLSREHDFDHLLQMIVEAAATVAGARYAAIGAYDEAGRIARFVHAGIDEETVALIGNLPAGRGLLGAVIVADDPIRIEDIGADDRACGFPPHHPSMRSFLGVPVRLGDRRFGNLYVTERRDGRGFDETDERLLTTLAAFAAAAIEGALLGSVERRSRDRGEMLAAVIDAQEGERARVARDLHDQIGQALTSVLLGLRLVGDSLERQPPDALEARTRLDEVRTLAADALGDVRQLAFELRPTVLDDVGLVPAIRRLAGDLSGRHTVTVEVTLSGIDGDSRFPPAVETVVYRVVQEALTNVARHARAMHATVDLSRTDRGVRAAVTDDGIGFDVPEDPPRSLGLAGMHERALLVGGTVTVASRPGAGTSVAIEVPVG